MALILKSSIKYFNCYPREEKIALFNKTIPAISDFKDFEKFISSNLKVCVLLNFRLAQLTNLVKKLKAAKKIVFIHAELIKGLANDEDGALYLIQDLAVDGIISSKSRVIELCKKRNVVGVYRFFLKDTLSLNQSLAIAKMIKPEYIEVLPFQGSSIIKKLKKIIPAKYLAGGLIATDKDVEFCLNNGAVAVTTSQVELWHLE
ncbi:MAG: glycerol-3-phosphate responsive antiterminator [Acholeplasmataceae bacterium]|nr:glycerol-3-phosphate responsive antiterminator [Acholeplasmataceae bacterium]HHT39381.1 glycerol-3-phosphate responsive antiterminator [Acholeplasmataceae bacterium]